MIRMRFLVDADLPRSTASVLASFGHQAPDVRDVGMREADDPTIAAYTPKSTVYASFLEILALRTFGIILRPTIRVGQ